MFHWLDMRRLGEVEPDRAIFPYASGRGDPRGDYLKELELFAKGIFDEDRSVADFLTAKDTYLNERVALLYGITDVKGDQFRRVELKDPARWGLLGKGAILMAAAYPNRTSPVLRGSFILEYITGAPPARPPLNVPAFPESRDRHGESAHRARHHGQAPREPRVLLVSRRHGSARLRAREFRRRRRLARQGSLRGHDDRFAGRAAGRHHGQRSGRTARSAGEAIRSTSCARSRSGS